jgi:hypothetical protein
LAIPVAAVTGIAILLAGLGMVIGVGTVALVTALASAPAGGPPSAIALAEIPPIVLTAYEDAAQTCPGLPWQVLAGIGAVESGQGSHGGARVDPATGEVLPPILGPALDGTGVGGNSAAIVDRGSADGWAHAEGPMQFLSTTFAQWRRTAPGHSPPADPNNFPDAIFTAAAYLCGGRPQVGDLHAAILSYNHSEDYYNAVWAKAMAYGMAPDGRTTMIGGGTIANPVPSAVETQPFTYRCTPAGCTGHPGLDLAVPVGTPILAPVTGIVDIMADDPSGYGHWVIMTDANGTQYRFGHLSAYVAASGAPVSAGTVIALSGATGNATGPHLHFEVRPGGGAPVDPAPLIGLAG